MFNSVTQNWPQRLGVCRRRRFILQAKAVCCFLFRGFLVFVRVSNFATITITAAHTWSWHLALVSVCLRIVAGRGGNGLATDRRLQVSRLCLLVLRGFGSKCSFSAVSTTPRRADFFRLPLPLLLLLLHQTHRCRTSWPSCWAASVPCPPWSTSAFTPEPPSCSTFSCR